MEENSMQVNVLAKHLMNGTTYHGILTNEHACSSYGQPVLVVDGRAVDICWYQISILGEVVQPKTARPMMHA